MKVPPPRSTGRAQRDTAPPRFPPEHAFVVQFGADVDRPAKQTAGRVEHVVSGRGRGFDGADDLFDFIDRIRRGRP